MAGTSSVRLPAGRYDIKVFPNMRCRRCLLSGVQNCCSRIFVDNILVDTLFF